MQALTNKKKATTCTTTYICPTPNENAQAFSPKKKLCCATNCKTQRRCATSARKQPCAERISHLRGTQCRHYTSHATNRDKATTTNHRTYSPRPPSTILHPQKTTKKEALQIKAMLHLSPAQSRPCTSVPLSANNARC